MNNTIEGNNEHVMNLAEILKNNGKENQALELTGLIEYVDTLEKQLGVVIAELKNVKMQLGDAQPQSAQTNRILDNMKKMQPQVAAVKEKIIQTAKSIVNDFKDKGIMALDRIAEFTGIKQSLTALDENISRNIQVVDKGINKVNAVSQEVNATLKHTKNVIRLVSNKERINAAAAPSKNLVKPLNAVKDALLKMEKNAKGAIDKLDRLSAKAAEKKPSIIESIKQHKENSKLSDKSMKAPKVEVSR